MRYYFALLLLAGMHIALAQDRSYSIVFLNKRAEVQPLPKDESDKLMKGHMDNINKLAAEGKLLAAGPFEGGGGLFIMNTTDKNQIEEWLKADPGIQAKRWNVEILPYKPRHGSVCPVKEPYEMVNYSLVRFDAVVSKFNANTYPEILKKHDEYIKKIIQTGNVVTEATFGGGDGGILVVKGDLQEDVLQMDPAVQEGLVDLQFKKLFIAKGSFCEK